MPAPAILFYAPNDPHGHYSNFSRHVVTIYGRTWRTSEHPFQAMKYHPHRPDLVKAVWEASGPSKAAALGRDRSLPIRPDWDSTIEAANLATLPSMEAPRLTLTVDDSRGPARVIERFKDIIMYQVVLAKFTQHEKLKEALLATGDAPLIENALHDPYWGWGASRTGINRLGKILMAVRLELQQ